MVKVTNNEQFIFSNSLMKSWRYIVKNLKLKFKKERLKKTIKAIRSSFFENSEESAVSFHVKFIYSLFKLFKRFSLLIYPFRIL